MSDAIVIALITSCFTLMGVFVSARATQNKVQTELQTMNAVQNSELQHIKEEMAEMKKDLKEHNGYAKSMPVIEEKLREIDRRLNKVEG